MGSAAWRRPCYRSKAESVRSSSVSARPRVAQCCKHAAYNFAELLPERRKMMQAWADYLDVLKASADVIPLLRKA